MNSEKKTCQNCKNGFIIEPEDFQFYEKMQTPAPTWCPQCRLLRRMLFTNERNLYRSKCGLCGKDIISMYHSDSPFPVYCKPCWWSDKWNPLEYGKEFDEGRPFLEQYFEVRRRVPRPAVVQQDPMEGSEYCNRAGNNKNCYLCFRASNNEDCMYSHMINDSRDCMDCYNVQKSELAFECIDCLGCYNVRFSQESQNCNNSSFLYDCRGCSDCFGCVGLRNKQYHIFNKLYSKDDYQKKLAELYSGKNSEVTKIQQELTALALKFIRPSMVMNRGENVSGNWIYDSTNIKESFMCRNVENGKYLFFITEGKDCMDWYCFGRGSERIYEAGNCGWSCSNMKFDNETFNSCSNLEYCDGSMNTSDCFGCAGLHHKKYCILNKQYTQEEYESLTSKIREQMKKIPFTDKAGRMYTYGEFFPPEFSPVAYNETVAQEFFPLKKEAAEKQGYPWRDPVERGHKTTLTAADVPEDIQKVDDSITKQVIECAHKGECTEQCTVAFKIIPQELAYYKKMNVPLPRLCPNCRHYGRLKQRTGITLHSRKCACAGKVSQDGVYTNRAAHFHADGACPNTFETTYAPDGKEIVYCEACYQAEVT